MCMITYVPSNVSIPVEGISNGAIINDDGHGWAIASADYGMIVQKSMRFEDALESFIETREQVGIDSLALFHSRIATAGTVDEFNVHPFFADEDGQTVLAHNGILPSKWQPSLHDRRSDTRIFVDHMLPRYLRDDTGIPSRRGGRALGDMIGMGNKFVIMSVKSGKPRARIVNAFLGDHHEGAWFSNSGYEKPLWRTYGRGSHASWWGDDYASRYPSQSLLGKDEQDREEKGFVRCDFCNDLAVDLDTDMCLTCFTCQGCYEWVDDCACAELDAKFAEAEKKAEAAEAEANEILGEVIEDETPEETYARVQRFLDAEMAEGTR